MFTVESASCVSAPCQNGGTCINQRKGFVCACRPPFGGPSCDIKLLDENAMKTGGFCLIFHSFHTLSNVDRSWRKERGGGGGLFSPEKSPID